MLASFRWLYPLPVACGYLLLNWEYFVETRNYGYQTVKKQDRNKILLASYSQFLFVFWTKAKILYKTLHHQVYTKCT